MKLLKVIAVALFAAFMLTACGGGSPESVAKSYLDAYINVDFKKAAKYTTKDYSDEILREAETIDSDEMKALVKARKDQLKSVKYKVTEVEADEVEATVRFEITLNGEVDDARIDLIKEDGKWKVEDDRIRF